MTQFQELLINAKNYFNRLKKDFDAGGGFSLLSSEYIYALRRIKVNVAYQKLDSRVPPEDKAAIEEILDLCKSAEELWKKG